MLPVELAKRVVAKDKRQLSEIVGDALAAYEGNFSCQSTAMESSKLPFAIRLTRTQNYLYSDQDIHAALFEWAGGRG
jgi:hypothetical protein